MQKMFKLDVPPQTGPFIEKIGNTLDRDMQMRPLGEVHVHLGDQLLHHVFIQVCDRSFVSNASVLLFFVWAWLILRSMLENA